MRLSAELVSIMLLHPVFNVPANAPRIGQGGENGGIQVKVTVRIYLMATGCHWYSTRGDRLHSNEGR